MEENLVLIIILASGGMLFLALAVVLFVITYQRKLLSQKLNQKISLQEAEQTYQKELLKSSVEVMESERQRIAKDLHDEIGASLTALKIYTGQINQNLQNIEKIKGINAQSRSLIEQTIYNIRTITQDLMPAALHHFGLIIALQETCDILNAHPDTQINFIHQLPKQRLSNTLELALYRIVRELLNNTYRYAEASEVLIKIQYLAQDQKIMVHYQDDGKGFDFQGFGKTNGRIGLGLKSIETRIQSVSGHIQLQSAVNQGIRVEISAPAEFVVEN